MYFIPNVNSIIQDLTYEFDVKKVTEDQVPLNRERTAPSSREDYLYMKVDRNIDRNIEIYVL